MGMFDYVSVRNNTELSCPCGRQITEFQTKSLGCSLSTVLIDGVVVSNPYDDGLGKHGCGKIHMYGECVPCRRWVTFNVIVTNWHVVSISEVK